MDLKKLIKSLTSLQKANLEKNADKIAEERKAVEVAVGDFKNLVDFIEKHDNKYFQKGRARKSAKNILLAYEQHGKGSGGLWDDLANSEFISELERWVSESEKDIDIPKGNISGMRWQDARKKAERIVDESDFQGFMKLKDAVGCAKRTLTKAINKSPKLTKAKSQYDAMSSILKAVGVTEKVLATYKQPSEGSQLSETEVKEILAEMIQQVGKEKPAMLEKTKLQIKEMNPTEKHNFAKVFQNEYKALKKHNRTPKKDEKRTFFSEPKKPHQHKKA